MAYNKSEEEAKVTEKLMKNTECSPEECVAYLVAYNGSLQIAHWMANTVTNEHKALGDLYESMVGFVDEFAEVYMGKSKVITFPKGCRLQDISDAPASKGNSTE
jgi:hypothetical protein